MLEKKLLDQDIYSHNQNKYPETSFEFAAVNFLRNNIPNKHTANG